MKKTLDIKKLILLNMPYILLGLFATNFGEAWRMAQGADASEKFLSLVAVLPGALQSFWPSLHPLDLLVGLCCGAVLRLAVYLKSKNAKKYRHGMEYGSARWGTREDTEGDTQMILAGQKSLFANGITFILFGFYTVYSSLFLALGKGAAGFFLGACRQGVCFVPVILLLPMVWGMNGILYAQPIADVISVVITVFMALHLHRELSMAEKQVMSNSEI